MPPEIPMERKSQLLRGRELALGLDIPLLNRPDVDGKEEALRALWANAGQWERDYINGACEASDRLLAQMELERG